MCKDKIKTIYRCETIDRIGIYVGGLVNGTFYDSLRHPSPSEDAGLKDAWNTIQRSNGYSKWLFGFKDLDQLRSWIYSQDMREHLKAQGVRIRVYKACDAHYGDTQAVFNTAGHFYKTGQVIDIVTFEETLECAETQTKIS